ncbi:hypothetical protein BASA60_009976 [Batrachochytrium salamandrivorans]|nr:hypothetical protein BASA60_009976 [Batrachochytrium salamandrivorans]
MVSEFTSVSQYEDRGVIKMTLFNLSPMVAKKKPRYYNALMHRLSRPTRNKPSPTQGTEELPLSPPRSTSSACPYQAFSNDSFKAPLFTLFAPMLPGLWIISLDANSLYWLASGLPFKRRTTTLKPPLPNLITPIYIHPTL